MLSDSFDRLMSGAGIARLETMSIEKHDPSKPVSGPYKNTEAPKETVGKKDLPKIQADVFTEMPEEGTGKLYPELSRRQRPTWYK